METVTNETTQKSSVDRDGLVIFAGHVLIVFYCSIFILGFFGMWEIKKKRNFYYFYYVILGNAAVIYVAIRKKKYRNVTNCYIANLALADLLFLTLSIPYTTYIGLVDHYPFKDTICKIFMYLAYVSE